MDKLDFDMAAAADRLIPFEGCHNFRHVAKWRTKDGRTLTQGRIFRSDGLNLLSDGDHELLASLGITHVFDLRGVEEIARAPSRWPDGFGADVWTGAQSAAEADLTRLMQQESQSAIEYANAMVRVYARFPVDLAAPVADLFSALFEHPDNRVLIHCAAGKDRTGFVTAMLLHAIGIAEDDIISDFLLSNANASAARAKFDHNGRLNEIEARAPGALRNLVGVHRAYLSASFDAVEQHHGGITQWLARHAGMDDKMRDSLQSQLLK